MSNVIGQWVFIKSIKTPLKQKIPQKIVKVKDFRNNLLQKHQKHINLTYRFNESFT